MAGAYYLKRRTCKHRARVSDDLEDPAMQARWPQARDGGGPSSKQAVPRGLGTSLSLRPSCPESLAVFRTIVTTTGVTPLLESNFEPSKKANADEGLYEARGSLRRLPGSVRSLPKRRLGSSDGCERAAGLALQSLCIQRFASRTPYGTTP